jgi:hypothetical protein
MMDKRPIFIMSSERSGSNLLRVMLSNHSLVSAPVTPQFLHSFSGTSRYYLPAKNTLDASNLYEVMLSIVNHEYHNWQITSERENFIKSFLSPDFLDFFFHFYEVYRKQKDSNKSRLLFKENATFDYAFQIKSKFPEAKFIYLYRDPRDYVASWLKVPLGHGTVEAATANWVSEQRKCDILISVFGLPVHHVKYEELISEPVRIMDKVLEFCGLPIEPNCYQTDPEKSKDIVWNEYWKNLDKPIDASNQGKYIKDLSTDEILYIESRSEEFMLKLGYAKANGLTLKNKPSLIQKFIKKFSANSFSNRKTTKGKTEELLGERQKFTHQLKQIGLNHFKSRYK